MTLTKRQLRKALEACGDDIDKLRELAERVGAPKPSHNAKAETIRKRIAEHVQGQR